MRQQHGTRMKPRPMRLLCVEADGTERRKLLLLWFLQQQLLLLVHLLVRGGRRVPIPVTLRCPVAVRPRGVVQRRRLKILLAIRRPQTQGVVRVLRLRRVERRLRRRIGPEQPAEVHTFIEQAGGIVWQDAEPHYQLVKGVRHRAGRRRAYAG